MTARYFDGKKIPSACDTRCKACGRMTYVWPTGVCDGCSYPGNPEMRAWVTRHLAAVSGKVSAT